MGPVHEDPTPKTKDGRLASSPVLKAPGPRFQVPGLLQVFAFNYYLHKPVVLRLQLYAVSSCLVLASGTSLALFESFFFLYLYPA